MTCSQIVNLIANSTKPQGSMTGQEERDILFARLFGLMSVVRSGLAFRSGTLPASGSSEAEVSTLTAYAEVVSQLIALGEKKSWLRESAWFAITLAVDALYESDVSWKVDAVNQTVQLLFQANEPWSPEKIALAVKLQTLYPNHSWEPYLLPPFKSVNLLSSGNLAIIARILKVHFLFWKKILFLA